MIGDSDDDEAEETIRATRINTVLVSNCVEIKIKKARENNSRFCCGYLLGHFDDEKVRVYDLIELDLSLFENVDVTIPLSDTIITELAGIRSSVPVGIDFIGFFITQPENGNIEVAEHLLRILKTLEEMKYADIHLVCLIKPSMSLWNVAYGDGQSQGIGNVIHQDMNLRHQPLFRIKLDYFVNWLVHTGKEGFQIELERVYEEVLSKNSSFLIRDIGVVLYEGNLPDWTCRDIISELKSSLDVKQWPRDGDIGNVIDVAALTKITSTPNLTSDLEEKGETNQNSCSVPVLFSQKISGECIKLKISLDVLVTASLDTAMHKLMYMFRDGIYRQQSALGLLSKKSQCKIVYKPLHFLTGTSRIPITVMLPSVDFRGNKLDEEIYSAYRSSLHQRFLLPQEMPLLRRCLSMFNLRTSYHLINPHEGLSTPHIEGGKLALVSGRYAYHHYMQDNFDDNVWGCAYRSLQTLASWFWLQGYTDKTYPSHKEIQEALVEIGDKDKQFIGSREWIGSMEVSYCLDQLLKITSKTLHVSTGADMAYKGRELYQHFIDQGTPIMIGGGVLAHTIVGIIYNEQTGDIRYLIVDPHFTGHDQLKTVQNKGWVGWKGPDFWNQTAHYNLCMPQRPKLI